MPGYSRRRAGTIDAQRAKGGRFMNGMWGPQGLSLSLTALVLVAVSLAHICLRRWIHRKVRQNEAAGRDPSTARHWVAAGLTEVAPAVLAVIWIQGLYAVINLLLRGVTFTYSEPVRLALKWCYGLSFLAALFWLLLRIGRAIDHYLKSLSRRLETAWDDVMLPLAGKAARRILPLLAFTAAAPILPASPGSEEMFRKGASLLLIGVIAFLLFQLVDATAAMVVRQYRIDVSDNLKARAIHTQVMVLKKAAVVIIGIFTLASILMLFDSARQFGASILASAGIAGIIVGFAAQRSIATLLAGFQIALTQPIRVDDVVIVENEWGRIEEITLTYVVVRIWDLRRLVMPITYFIEQPFQNWTRSSADILATVFLYVDYCAPLDALRAELTRILSASTSWDGKVNVLQVTDAKEHTVELRALASASNASLAWDLRCEVREKLLTFLRRNYPESLPRFRAAIETVASNAPTSNREISAYGAGQ
ncbi:MAG TPA: mechanosensitive ion channel domain-containing protein [Bryobacteraceae bacterium]|nr:mechanosensitive ion channel domain-containing protein [Bryobacteraceae bacterium]